MIRSSVFKLAFCLVLIMGLSLSFAFAEEVPVSHTEDVTYTTVYHTSSDYQIAVTTDSWNYCPDPTQTNWIGGNAQRDLRTLYKAPYPTTVEGTGTTNAAYYMSLYDTIWGYYNPQMPTFTLTLSDCSFTLDTSDLPAGYYRYIVHFYYGCAFSNANTVSSSVQPSYLGISSYTEDFTSIAFNGLVQCQNYFAGNSYPFRSDLLEFTFDTVFYCDGNTSETEFNLYYWISQLGKNILGYDLTGYTIGRYYYLNIWANNRYYTELYGNVEPPVTPTPSPTPYPGQDTQESINSGVQQIVSDLSVVATPVPTPIGLDLDETVLDQLESVTLPDMSNQQLNATFTNLWDIFSSLWSYLGILFGSIVVVSVFCFVIGGRWL